jgi:Uncharacterised nucleotidyltransferase
MGDVDVVVPARDAGRAATLLSGSGWSPRPEPPPDYLAISHSWAFQRRDGHDVDLHWRIFAHSRAPEDEAWAVAEPLRLGGADTRALCGADHLLLVLEHGLEWNPASPVRWIPDAVAIIRGGVDWDRLCALAGRHRASHAAAIALAYLRATFAPEIPPEVVERLRATPASRGERRLHEARVGPPHTVPAALRRHLAAYRAVRAARPGGVRRISFPSFLRQRWGLTGIGSLPGFVGRELAERRRR